MNEIVNEIMNVQRKGCVRVDLIHVQQHADEVNDTRFHDVLPNVLLYPLASNLVVHPSCPYVKREA